MKLITFIAINLEEPRMKIIPTTPFTDQRPGTSGLRKKTAEFMKDGYIQNFVQSIFDVLREDGTNFADQMLIIGGDGRYYNRVAIQIILRLAAANRFGRVMVGGGGILSTPAMSAVIRRRGALGGLILSASHNPGGIMGDFGIKFNTQNGGPAPETFTERVFQRTLEIDQYLWVDVPDVVIDHEHTESIMNTEVTVFDPLADYTALMQELFDFDALRTHLRSGFRIVFDGMHGSTICCAIFWRVVWVRPPVRLFAHCRSKISAEAIRTQTWCTRRIW